MRSRGEQEDFVADSGARLSTLAPLLIAAGGLGGCGVLLWTLREAEAAEARSHFELEATRCISDAQRELCVVLEQIHSTVAFFASSHVVEQEEFRSFVAGSLGRYPPLRAMLWIEPSAPDAGLRVRFGEGPEAATFPLGAAPPADPALSAALAQASAKDELTLSGPFATDAGKGPRVLAAVQVPGRDGRVQGLVGGLVDAAPILEPPPDVARARGFELSAEDVASPALPLAGGPADGELVRSEERVLGGRTWRFACVAEPGFLAARTTWLPWGVFVLGLMATALLAATVATATSRARIQRLVERRSQEVLKAYDTLAQEAQERLWAVSEARKLQHQLREIVDLVPSMIFVRDWHGRFLLANEATAAAYGTSVAKLTASSNVDIQGDVGEPDSTLREERDLMERGLSAVMPAVPFVDGQGRRRILREVKIPCTVFGKDRRALLCVATDITEQKHTEDILRTQYRILSEIAAGADIDRILAQLVGAAEEVVPGMRCSVLLMTLDGRHLRHKCAPSLPGFYNAAVDGLEIGPDAGSCGAAAHSGQRVIVEDVLSHANWAPYREIALRARIRACWSQPIRASDGEILGTFAMYYSEPRAPEPFEEDFMESVAHLAAIALERERSSARPSTR